MYPKAKPTLSLDWAAKGQARATLLGARFKRRREPDRAGKTVCAQLNGHGRMHGYKLGITVFLQSRLADAAQKQRLQGLLRQEHGLCRRSLRRRSARDRIVIGLRCWRGLPGRLLVAESVRLGSPGGWFPNGRQRTALALTEIRICFPYWVDSMARSLSGWGRRLGFGRPTFGLFRWLQDSRSPAPIEGKPCPDRRGQQPASGCPPVAGRANGHHTTLHLNLNSVLLTHHPKYGPMYCNLCSTCLHNQRLG